VKETYGYLVVIKLIIGHMFVEIREMHKLNEPNSWSRKGIALTESQWKIIADNVENINAILEKLLSRML